MTRKKSNVKALALAVTCAILAGGYSGLNPVYAADDTTSGAAGTVNGTITSGTISGTVTGSSGSSGDTFNGTLSNASITISGDNIASALDGVDISKAKVTKNDDDSTGETLQSVYGKVLENSSKTTKISLDTEHGTVIDGKLSLKGSGAEYQEITTDKIKAYDNAVTATKGITYQADTTTVGGVGFNNGVVTGVKSINAGDSSAKFKVTEDDSSYTFRAGNFQVTTGKETDADGNVQLNGKVTLSDTNRSDQHITIDEMVTTRNKTEGISRESTGEYTEIEGKFKVKSDGSISAANNAFSVDSMGTVSGANDSKLGSVGFSDGKIYSTNDASKNVAVSDLITDHNIVNDAESGNVILDRRMKSVEGKTEGIKRTTLEGTTIHSTAVEGILEVYENGTVTINENAANNPVTINSKGIKVGNNSAVVSEDGFKTSGDLYVGTKTTPTEDSTESRFYVKGADGSIKAADGKFTVDAYGAVSAADGKFGVDKVGNATVGGTLDVTGATTLKDTLTVTGKTTLNDELEVAGSATFKDNIAVANNIKGKTLNIGTTGNEFSVDADGAVKAAGGKVEIDKTGKAIFGNDANNQTVIEGNKVTTGYIQTDANAESSIGGVKFQGGVVTATKITAADYEVDKLTVKQELKVGTTGNTTLTDGTLKLGTDETKQLTAEKLDNFNKTIKADQVIEAKSGKIGTVTFTEAGVVDGISDITATKGTIGNVSLDAGKITAANGGTIGGVAFDGTGNIKAKTFKVDDDNYFNSSGITANGITAKKGTIGVAVINETTLTVGATKLDKADGITTNKLTIGGMTLTGTALDTDTADFQVNGVTFNQGQVTAAADKGFVTGTSSFKQGSLIVSDNNKLESGTGLITEKAAVNGTLDVTDEATFGTAGNQTKIKGNVITTDTLKTNKLILGAEGTTTVEVDKDGSFKAANGKFEVSKEGALKAADGAFKVNEDGKTIFRKDDDNQSSINGGNIWAKATDAAANTSSTLLHNYKGLKVSGTKAGQTSSFDFDTETGVGTFIGLDGTKTTVNGSKITSTKSATESGVLDGSNLTLTEGENKTELTAGGATFTKDGKTTTIDGNTITTGKLITDELVITGKGNAAGDGGSIAFGGNGTIKSNIKGEDGTADAGKETTFETKLDGVTTNVTDGTITTTNAVKASGNTNTVTNGVSTSSRSQTATEITDKVDNAESTITKDSITDKVGTDAKNTTVTTTDNKFSVKGATDKGMDIDTDTGKTTFTGANYKEGATEAGTTTIDGNTITTGKLVTDQLVIKGNGSGNTSGDGGESGSIAFGGDGTITSNIKDGANETTFKTTADGVSSEVTNGTYTSNVDQSADRIGSVITGGNVKIGSVADVSSGVLQNGAGTVNADGDTVTEASQIFNKDGSITSIAKSKDADGNTKTSNMVQNGDGLTITNGKDDTKNITKISDTDVSITDQRNDSKRINLSDLGQIDELDNELSAREEFSSNKTAVGGINAEAAIRREEIARLDNRIDDVNDRVNKVGAMAAAIASLKSIGYDPQAPSEFSVGLGQYKGETGVALGFFHYPNKNFMVNVSLSTAGGETMGGIGATWRFGHKSPQKLLDEQRAAQAKKELAAAEKYKAAAQLAKEAQERAEYAAKLARQAQVSADNAKAAADATQAKHFGK